MADKEIKKNVWSKLQYQCYARGCNCHGCPMITMIESAPRCQVKYSILNFIKQYGLPIDVQTKGVINEKD